MLTRKEIRGQSEPNRSLNVSNDEGSELPDTQNLSSDLPQESAQHAELTNQENIAPKNNELLIPPEVQSGYIDFLQNYIGRIKNVLFVSPGILSKPQYALESKLYTLLTSVQEGSQRFEGDTYKDARVFDQSVASKLLSTPEGLELVRIAQERDIMRRESALILEMQYDDDTLQELITNLHNKNNPATPNKPSQMELFTNWFKRLKPNFTTSTLGAAAVGATSFSLDVLFNRGALGNTATILGALTVLLSPAIIEGLQSKFTTVTTPADVQQTLADLIKNNTQEVAEIQQMYGVDLKNLIQATNTPEASNKPDIRAVTLRKEQQLQQLLTDKALRKQYLEAKGIVMRMQDDNAWDFYLAIQ
jgi:hypothetical protein